MIIGITGYDRVGKDTFADFLVDGFNQSGYKTKKISIASPLKFFLKKTLNLTYEEIEDLKKQKNFQFPIFSFIF